MNSHRIIFLYDDNAMHIGTVRDHVRSFSKYSRHEIVTIDVIAASYILPKHEYFDVLVLHYSIVISSVNFISDSMKTWVSSFSGKKIVFIQDEYRWVDKTAYALFELGIDVVFSVVNSDALHKVYHHECLNNIRFETSLTGFVPEELLAVDVPPYSKRCIDVAYRARKVPAWLGEFGQKKWVIGKKFKEDAKKYNIKVDIASDESKRLYGKDWIRFLSNSKAVLGVESGASICDFDDVIRPSVEDYEAKHPDTPFKIIKDKFLQGFDGNVVIHVISPRCFESAALKTLMIMYPGSYSGILTPWEHYVPLEEDHTNMEQVISIIQNESRANDIIENAYNEIACSQKWTYKSFVQEFDKVVNEIIGSKMNEIDKEMFLSEIKKIKIQASRTTYIRKMKRKILDNGVKVIDYVKHKIIIKFPPPIQKIVLPIGRLFYRIARFILRPILLGVKH